MSGVTLAVRQKHGKLIPVIRLLEKAGFSDFDIAQVLGVSKSVIKYQRLQGKHFTPSPLQKAIEEAGAAIANDDLASAGRAFALAAKLAGHKEATSASIVSIESETRDFLTALWEGSKFYSLPTNKEPDVLMISACDVRNLIYKLMLSSKGGAL